MVRPLVARSISRAVQAKLIPGAGSVWHVLAVFDHACDLVTPFGDVVAVVLPKIGNGPLNIVIDGKPGVFSPLEPGMVATLQGAQAQIGGLRVALDQAEIWEPRPAWEHLRQKAEQIEDRLSILERFALQRSPPGSLLDSLSRTGDRVDSPDPGRAGLEAFQEALLDLRAGWTGDLGRLRRGAAQLAGLGVGLTPAGDDFLAGFMLRAWLQHPAPRSFCLEIVETAAPRTTTLSAALLRAAARGECNGSWHALLAALDLGRDLSETVHEVLSYGHTSGADTLAGFLCCSAR